MTRSETPVNIQDDIKILQQQAESDLSQGKYQAAIAKLQTILEISPQFAQAHFKLSEALLAEQQFQAALSAANRAIQLCPAVFIYHVGRGRVLAVLEQWDQVIDTFQRAIQLNPEFSWSYTYLAQAYMVREQYTEAVAAYRQDIRLNPTFYWSHFHLGEALLKLGKREAAIAAYRQAMAIDSTQPDVQARLRDLLTSRQINGDYWLQQGDWEMAIQAYQETLEFQPDYSWSYYGLGYALQQQQWWSEAAAAYRQALQLNPDFSISYSNLGDCLFRQGQVENAIHAYHQALSINPDVPDTQMRLGDAYLFQGRTDAAIVCYQAAIQLDPQSLPVYLKLRQLKTYGLVRFKPEQIQSLINSYQQVIQQHPDHVECYVNLGDILTEAGQIDPAIKAYTQGTYQKLAQCRPQWIQGWDDHVTPQPGFLIIGAQKAGSTSLYQYLCHHPQVLPPLQKEIDFFVWQSAYGLEWYLSHFPRIDSEQTLITGEASPSYILDFKVAQQLREAFPNIKLLVILRNPIDRAFSQYHNYKRWINFESRTLEQAIADEQEILKQIDNVTLAGKTFWETQEGYLVRGMYVYFLEQWMSIFPREQFLILKSEDLYADPQVIMNQVFRFLGLPEYSSDRYLKYASGSYAPISVELRQELQNFFQPHNQRLEEFLGYQLNWQ